MWAMRRANKILMKARNESIECDLTKEVLEGMYRKTGGRCPVSGCGREFEFFSQGSASPTIDRILPSRGYVRQNIQVICRTCNSVKNGMTIEQAEHFLEQMKKKRDEE